MAIFSLNAHSSLLFLPIYTAASRKYLISTFSSWDENSMRQNRQEPKLLFFSPVNYGGIISNRLKMTFIHTTYHAVTAFNIFSLLQSLSGASTSIDFVISQNKDHIA